MQKAAAIKKQRRLTNQAVEAEEIETFPWKKCSVKADFYYASKRRRDTDNAIGSLKSTYDGLVDAGVVPDDDAEHMIREMPDFHIDRKCPRVEITVTRLA
jgi:Holliday junction resolvase RusA-like endonuclease